MRIIFAGTPMVAIPAFTTLLESAHELVGVLTRPDAPVGRQRVVTPSPIARVATGSGIPVIKAHRPGDTVVEEVKALAPDLGVVVAYGALLTEPLLSVPRYGWVNLHFSVLPRWRGAAPVQRAILAGDSHIGATVFALDAELDSGPIYDTILTTIRADETAGELLGRLARESTSLLVSVVDGIEAGSLTVRPQEGEVTFAPKLSSGEGRIDWSRALERVYTQIRGVTPEPGAYTTVGKERLNVAAARMAPNCPRLAAGVMRRMGHRIIAGTATFPLELIEVQPAGKRLMRADEWWNGVGKSEVCAQ